MVLRVQAPDHLLFLHIVIIFCTQSRISVACQDGSSCYQFQQSTRSYCLLVHLIRSVAPEFFKSYLYIEINVFFCFDFLNRFISLKEH